MQFSPEQFSALQYISVQYCSTVQYIIAWVIRELPKSLIDAKLVPGVQSSAAAALGGGASTDTYIPILLKTFKDTNRYKYNHHKKIHQYTHLTEAKFMLQFHYLYDNPPLVLPRAKSHYQTQPDWRLNRTRPPVVSDRPDKNPSF